MKYSILSLLLLIPALLPAQDRRVSARRTYTVAVQERSSEEQNRFSNQLQKEMNRSGSRGIAADLFNS